MPIYEVYPHADLFETIPESGLVKRRIMDFVRHLRLHPNMAGDFTDKDASLRERQIKVIGDYAITFRLDEPVKIVMVVDIRPANQ